jgi:hypothetical protein
VDRSKGSTTAGETDMLPDIHRRVVTAKYILERAARIQSENNEMSKAVSLLLMHDAVELLMHGVLDHLSIKKKFEFMGFWSAVKDAGHPEPQDHAPMETLNKLRVGLKHSGILPRSQTVQELLPRTRGFFENVLKAYCSIDYASVSLIDLVSDQEVRSTLSEAQSRTWICNSAQTSWNRMSPPLAALATPIVAPAVRSISCCNARRIPLYPLRSQAAGNRLWGRSGASIMWPAKSTTRSGLAFAIVEPWPRLFDFEMI